MSLSVIVGDSVETIEDTAIGPVSRTGSDTVVSPAAGRDEPVEPGPGLPTLAFSAIERLRPRLLTVVLPRFTVVVRSRFCADSECHALSLAERDRFLETITAEPSDAPSELQSSVDVLSWSSTRAVW